MVRSRDTSAAPDTTTNTAVTETTVEDTTRTWPAPDYFAGTLFRADIHASATETLDDDHLSPITANSALLLTSPDLPAGLVTGASYRGVSVIDRLTVRGHAQVLAEGDLLIYGGDGGAVPETFTVAPGATLQSTHQLELFSVECDQVEGAVTGQPLVCLTP